MTPVQKRGIHAVTISRADYWRMRGLKDARENEPPLDFTSDECRMDDSDREEASAAYRAGYDSWREY